MTYLLWQGPSQLDPESNILLLATNQSRNKATGDMIQTYIIRSDMSPSMAIRNKKDDAICGQCPLRNGSCYVLTFQGPDRIFNASWEPPPRTLTKKRLVRLGAYGDPAAVPIKVWDNWLRKSAGWTGYTHQWKNFPKFQKYCMASVESIEEAKIAQSMGWRTFRITNKNDRQKNEALCPKHDEKLTCSQCNACDGNRRNLKGNIVIPVHGAPYKIKAFKKYINGEQYGISELMVV